MHMPKQSCICLVLLKAVAVRTLQALVPAKPSGVHGGAHILDWGLLYLNST